MAESDLKYVSKTTTPEKWHFFSPPALLFVVQVLVLHRFNISWQQSLADAFISNVLLLLLIGSASFSLYFFQPEKNNWTLRLGIGLGFGLLYSFLNWKVLEFFFEANAAYLDFILASIPIRLVFALLLFFFLTILIWMQSHLNDEKEMEARRKQIEKMKNDAELDRLRQQLQPHFLFNSLNSINALIGTRPEKARQMIQNLSDFLRGTLKKEQQLILLEEELEQIQLYMDIEKVRFGDRLQVEMRHEPAALKIEIPAFILQPMVENAIKFGLYDVLDAVTISISCHVEGAFLLLMVRNPFDINSHNTKAGAGFGLPSLQRRLQLLYGRNDLLSYSKTDGVFTCTLKIPISK